MAILVACHADYDWVGPYFNYSGFTTKPTSTTQNKDLSIHLLDHSTASNLKCPSFTLYVLVEGEVKMYNETKTCKQTKG